MAHRLLCVHPHPDDESIACGGLIARSLRDGLEVHVVTCTGGEEGDNQSGIDLGGRPMDEVRRDEMAAAVVALGGPVHHWLGYRDSGMAGTPANDHPEAFHGASLDEAAARLAAIVRSVRPHVVTSDDEHGTYGHPDHVRAHEVTTAAIAVAADPDADVPGAVWRVPKRYVHTLPRERMVLAHNGLLAAGLASPFGTEPLDDPADMPFGAAQADVTARIDVTDVLEVKRAAMAAHRSQIGEDSFFLNTPDGLAVTFFGEESYVLLDGTAHPGPDGLERDLFAGIGTDA